VELRLNAALNGGLDAGLTVNEIKEVLVQMCVCGISPQPERHRHLYERHGRTAEERHQGRAWQGSTHGDHATTGFTLPSSTSSLQKTILAALSEFTIPRRQESRWKRRRKVIGSVTGLLHNSSASRTAQTRLPIQLRPQNLLVESRYDRITT